MPSPGVFNKATKNSHMKLNFYLKEKYNIMLLKNVFTKAKKTTIVKLTQKCFVLFLAKKNLHTGDTESLEFCV